MKQYLDLLQYILDNGEDREDRTGTGTRSIFGHQMKFDLQEGFPLVTTKKMFWRGIVEELLWMISGNVDVGHLENKGVKIWTPWKKEDGTIGPGYGKQFRNWTGIQPDLWPDEGREYSIDQLAKVIESIKTNPFSRRHIISLWNVSDLPYMVLPPCHGVVIQFYVSRNNKLSCQMYQRSGDALLGIPFNISSYALLTHLIAQVCSLDVGTFVHTLGDCHIYNNHELQVHEQIRREPKELPQLVLNPDIKDIDDFKYEDIHLVGYESWPTIKAPISI